MLAAHRTIYHWSAGLDCDATGCAGRHRTVNDTKSRLILCNIFNYLSDELLVTKWKTNVHDIASLKWCAKINIYAENFVLCLNDLKQWSSYFAKPDNDYSLVHVRVFLIPSRT
jgi:hypothetical protein